MVDDYRVVVPSRHRPENIKRLRQLFNKFTLVISKEDEEDYKMYMGDHDITIKHQPKRVIGISATRKFIMDTFKEKTIVFVDDDIDRVKNMVGMRPRYYDDPDTILSVIENSIQVTRDLGISLFYFNRNPNPGHFDMSRPFALVGGFASSVFGINGRSINFDSNLTTREDVDITLSALAKDRIIFYDMRWYFDVGRIWSGDGGNQGMRTHENEEQDMKYLYSKWSKRYINFGKDVHKNVTGTSIKVKRKSALL